MMNESRKAINFDLDTNRLKNVFSDYTIAYGKLKTSFLKRGFEHRQGSGYVSIKEISYTKLFRRLNQVFAENEWLKTCAKKFDVTEIGETFDLMTRIRSIKPTKNSPTLKAVQRDDEELERD